MRNFKSKHEPNSDLTSLRYVMNHYATKFSQSIQPAVKSRRRNDYLARQAKLRKYKHLQEEYQTKLLNQENLLRITRHRKPNMLQTGGRFLQLQFTLLVVDYLESDDNLEGAAVGLNLDPFFRSTLRRNLLQFFDEEVWQLVTPMINSIKHRNVQNKAIPDGIADRCGSIKTKNEFLAMVRQLVDQNFHETLDDVIRFFFIPVEVYRKQIISDLVEQINQMLNAYTQNYKDRKPEVLIEKICSIKGELITDFLQIEYTSRYLICYSSSLVILKKLPILERLIEHFRKKFNIDFAEDASPLQKKSVAFQDHRFNARSSLRRAVNVLKQEPERASKTFDIKSPINCFLERIKVSQIDDSKLDQSRMPSKKTLGFFDQIVSVVKSSKGQGVNDDYFLTPYEIQMFSKEFPGFTSEDFINILNDFKLLTMQNEYFEIKNSFDKTQKAPSKRHTYAVLLMDQQAQLKKIPRESYFKIVRSADIKLAFDFTSTPIDWNQYVRLRAILVGNINEQLAGNFLKSYFDAGNGRWVPSHEIDEMLSQLPSSSFPETFRYMFTSLVKNWFKELNFYREDQFDCNVFLMAAASNLGLMKYIIQWIVGLYEPEASK